MFIRVVQLINININNSYITTLQQLSVFSSKQLALSVKTHSTPHTLNRQSILTPPRTIQGLKHHQLKHLSHANPISVYHPTLHNPHSHTPFVPPRSKSPPTTKKNSHSDCYLGNLITLNVL